MERKTRDELVEGWTKSEWTKVARKRVCDVSCRGECISRIGGFSWHFFSPVRWALADSIGGPLGAESSALVAVRYARLVDEKKKTRNGERRQKEVGPDDKDAHTKRQRQKPDKDGSACEEARTGGCWRNMSATWSARTIGLSSGPISFGCVAFFNISVIKAIVYFGLHRGSRRKELRSRDPVPSGISYLPSRVCRPL